MSNEQTIEALAMVEYWREESERLKAALGDMFALIDEGFLCRDTSRDAKDTYLLLQMRFISRLARNKKALDGENND